MPIQSWGKRGNLAHFGLKIGYSGHDFWDMDFKFILPTIYINIKKSIGTKLTILSSNQPQNQKQRF